MICVLKFLLYPPCAGSSLKYKLFTALYAWRVIILLHCPSSLYSQGTVGISGSTSTTKKAQSFWPEILRLTKIFVAIPRGQHKDTVQSQALHLDELILLQTQVELEWIKQLWTWPMTANMGQNRHNSPKLSVFAVMDLTCRSGFYLWATACQRWGREEPVLLCHTTFELGIKSWHLVPFEKP